MTVDGGGGTDTMTVEGTSANDTFDVAALNRAVTVNGSIPIIPVAITNLVLNGYAGDDSFTIFGGQPYANIAVNGGDPSASDVVFLEGDGTPIAVTPTLLGPTVAGGGLGTVTLTGIEEARIESNGGAVTFLATAIDNTLRDTPFSDTIALVTRDGLNTVFFVDTDNPIGAPGTLTFDLDSVPPEIPPSTRSSSTARPATMRSWRPATRPLPACRSAARRLPLLIDASDVASLVINGLAGDDNLTVETYAPALSRSDHLRRRPRSNSLTLSQAPGRPPRRYLRRRADHRLGPVHARLPGACPQHPDGRLRGTSRRCSTCSPPQP